MKKVHSVVTAYIFNNDFSQILMVWHEYLDVWLPPGGHINENETPIDAIYRELAEETEIEGKIIDINEQIVLQYEPNEEYNFIELFRPFALLLESIPKTNIEDTHYHIDHIYILNMSNKYSLNNIINNNDNVRWVTISKLHKIKTMPNVPIVVDSLLKKCSNKGNL